MAVAFMAVVCVARGAGGPQELPLPDRATFLREIRGRLHSDATLLQAFTYRRSVTERDRDSSGRVTATRTRVYDVHPLPDDPDGFRILIQRDGVAQPKADIDRAEADYRERLARFARANTPDERARRRAQQAEEDKEDRENVEDVVRLFDVQLVRRETLHNTPCVLLTFTPRAEVEPRTRAGRFVKNVSGKAWFAEHEYELVRVEAAVVEPISYAWGIIARINKGATAAIERQRMPDGKWLPARYQFRGEGRVMLVKTVQRDATVVFSDFRPAPRAAVTQ